MKIIKGMLVVFLLLINTACAGELVNVKLHIIEEDGSPVENANVVMKFFLGKGSNIAKGETDEKGYISKTSFGALGASLYVSKEGYYYTGFRTRRGDQEVTLVLRKKKKPQLMYARQVSIKFPVKNKKIGFDFEKADWVIPYGKGVTTHIFFEFAGQKQVAFNYNTKLQVSFPNTGDGLIVLKRNKKLRGAFFEYPYLAPLTGYQQSIKHFENSSEKKKKYGYDSTYETSLNTAPLGYIIRTNTELDKQNEVIKANYARLFAEFELYAYTKGEGNSIGYITFKYAYNPTVNERSLEFDYRNNLFGELPGTINIAHP